MTLVVVLAARSEVMLYGLSSGRWLMRIVSLAESATMMSELSQIRHRNTMENEGRNYWIREPRARQLDFALMTELDSFEA